VDRQDGTNLFGVSSNPTTPSMNNLVLMYDKGLLVHSIAHDGIVVAVLYDTEGNLLDIKTFE